MEAAARAIKTLIIDNYDSYTFNLFQLLAKVTGQVPDVIRNDSLSWSPEVLDRLRQYDNIVLSPGPGHPANEKDFGLCSRVLEQVEDIPILGVCLGHQGLAQVFGGEVVLAPQVAHGVLSVIAHDSDLFEGIPSTLQVVRYHSWIVSEATLPSCLEKIAWTVPTETDEDSLIMAIRHKEKPFWGVQFHPESVCTEYGEQLLKNFCELSLQYRHKKGHSTPSFSSFHVLPPQRSPPPLNVNYDIRWEKLEASVAVNLENAFIDLYAEKEYCFWLNSTRVERGLSRFSFMGAAALSLAYNVQTRCVSIKLPSDSGAPFADNLREGEVEMKEEQTFFDYLQNEVIDTRKCKRVELPFDFQCGVVGYFGYEMKQECYMDVMTNEYKATTPDSAFIFVDRMIAYDHWENTAYLVALVNNTSAEHQKDIEAWFAATKNYFYNPPLFNRDERSHTFGNYECADEVKFSLQRGHDTYVENIKQCLREIRNGESYEICLTNKVLSKWAPNDVQLFYKLRKINPAPYAGFLRFSTFSIVCCSPEKFMTINTENIVESKPIKGTVARGKTPEEDEQLKLQLKESKKDFSENLMIVDLIRNDIGKVCDIGSVHVPLLMNVESYSTVHQLVTTVRGRLRDDLSPCECIKQSFPPGSMTGAPKLRSLQIIDQLEQSARGVYSGVLGWIGLNGSCDMCVVIRTAVLDTNGIYIGCGGAIVADSDEEGEFDEMLLKSNVLVHTLLSIKDPKHTKEAGVVIEGVPCALKAATNTDDKPPSLEIFSAEKFLVNLPSSGKEYGLQNLLKVLELLGKPQESVPFIHVTGTNGKGSVCSTLSCILKHCGYSVGRYISPHLVDWRESITQNDELISVEDFNACGLMVSNAMQEHDIHLTQFEALTAMAFCYFHNQKLDIGVIEVGMGGKRDATNVFSSPVVSLFTSIGMDHAQFLGNTPAKIADEKSGIMKEGCPAVVAQGQLEEVQEMLRIRAKEKGCPLYWGLTPEEATPFISEFALKGEHQVLNLGVIMRTVEVLRNEGWHLDWDKVVTGLKTVVWPGRLQTLNWKGRSVLIDGAHNPDGGRALKKYIDSLMYPASETPKYTRIHWIIGMLAHKDHMNFLREVFGGREGFPQCIVTVPVKPNVAWLYSTSAAGLAKTILDMTPISQLEKAEREGGVIVSQSKSVEEALDASISLDEDTLVVLSGSLHLCGQVLALLDKVSSPRSPGSPEKVSRAIRRREDFKLLETILWEKDHGYFLLESHLDRLTRSAYYFGYKDVNRSAIVKALGEKEDAWRTQGKEGGDSILAMRVRLLVDEGGSIEIQDAPFTMEDRNKKRFSLVIAPSPVYSDDTFLFHKTTNRKVYNDAWALKGEADDVILYNEKGEVTETCIANIAVQVTGGKYVTPPLSSGLLGGVMRQKLLEEGEIEERVITLKELTDSPSIKLFNSVRGMFDGYLLA